MNVGPSNCSVLSQAGGDRSTATDGHLVTKVRFCNAVSESRRDECGCKTIAAVLSAVWVELIIVVSLMHSPWSKVMSLRWSWLADDTSTAQYVGPCGSTNTERRVL